jgi:hypothetical protein
MLDFDLLQWIAVAVAALIIGVTKTGIPGIGILAVILMASSMPARLSVGFILPLLITGDIFAVAYYRRHADWRHLFRLIPAALVGILIGWALLHYVFDEPASTRPDAGRAAITAPAARSGPPDSTAPAASSAPAQASKPTSGLRPVMGGLILVLLGLDVWWKRYAGPDAIPRHRAVAMGVGVAAGITTMLANAAGSLIALYFIAMRFDKHRFIGTAAWYFLLLNCVKVPFFISEGMITTATFRTDLVLMPVVLVGGVVGVLVLKRIPQAWFIRVVRVLAAVGSVWLIVGETVKGWLQGGS